MSATFNEISYRIFNTIIPKIGDDESIDISEIQYDVETTRAMLVKQRYSNKFKTSISQSLVQHIPKLEIENTNASNLYPDIPSDQVLMKTILQVPNILQKSSGIPMVQRISASTVLSKNFSIVTPEQAISAGNGKFNQKNIFCFFENNYLYFITKRLLNKGIKYIDLYAVFERPTKANEFLNENYSSGITDDDEYPIPLDMIGEIEKIIIKDKLRIESSQPIDDINDASDTSKQITNPDR